MSAEGSSSNPEPTEVKSAGDADTVRQHYNKISEQAAAVDSATSKNNRYQSRIVQLRNFNNWMKSCLIQEYIERTKEHFGRDAQLCALDICCGKGGDLQKWRAASISKLVGVDISDRSVDECRQRYQELRETRKRPAGRFPQRGGDSLFNGEFHVADCGRVRLVDLYEEERMRFHIVSCQFSLHYTFETYDQADMMMRNCSESLRKNGHFVCTIPNANEIVRRCRGQAPLDSASQDDSFGKWHNEVANIAFANPDSLREPNQPPLFGARYSFFLEGVVVDCPEFLIHIPLLQKLALRHGLRMVLCERFDTFFNRKCRNRDNYELLDRIRALQPFSLTNQRMRSDLRFDIQENYSHAVDHLQRTREYAVRTMSKAEWDVATLYMVVAFEKITDDRCASSTSTSTATAQASQSGQSAVSAQSQPSEQAAKQERQATATATENAVASKRAKLS